MKGKLVTRVVLIGAESKWDTEAHQKAKYRGCQKCEVPGMDRVAFFKNTPITRETGATYDRPVNGS